MPHVEESLVLVSFYAALQEARKERLTIDMT